MFKRVLVANRGEIAVRIIRTLRRLGIASVAVYSDVDATALHVRCADRAIYIGESPPAESYLDGEAILEAALESGAEAIHSGYGFLSENAEFAEACAEAGIVFIGPSPEAMRSMGDKVQARRLMSAAGVPVVPGYDGADGRAGALEKAVAEIGFPLMVKAAAGGGGRGMRVVRVEDELQPALEAANREATAAFGDGRLFIERLIEGGRHIEAQIFGDNTGRVAFLGERECSIQRRHQKVVEETPSSAVSDAVRAQIADAAVKAGEAVGYQNAGTVEFLLAPDDSFYFLEMNTRLQVEHPVTEQVLGVDLVEWQLRVAAGEPLPDPLPEPRGSSIEFRVYAEDPRAGFLPRPGIVEELRAPDEARLDSGYESGDEISTFYDPLIAKLVVHAESRELAVEEAQRALGEVLVRGPVTNLQLLRSIAGGEDFAAGRFDVNWLERQLAAATLELATPERALIAAAVADLDPVPSEPWAMGAWRGSGLGGLLRYQVDGEEVDVGHSRTRAGSWALTFAGKTVAVEASAQGPAEWRFDLDGDSFVATARRLPAFVEVRLEGSVYAIERLGLKRQSGPALATRIPGGGAAVTAPMPGVVLKIAVSEGEAVRAGQTLAVLEAMKMEHALKAPADAVVKEVLVEEGQRVEEGALLISLGPAASDAGDEGGD
ncbi:MAG: biotin carboxylase N-terminal domain-containing protein [Dehalococcoidia bacterium]